MLQMSNSLKWLHLLHNTINGSFQVLGSQSVYKKTSAQLHSLYLRWLIIHCDIVQRQKLLLHHASKSHPPPFRQTKAVGQAITVSLIHKHSSLDVWWYCVCCCCSSYCCCRPMTLGMARITKDFLLDKIAFISSKLSILWKCKPSLEGTLLSHEQGNPDVEWDEHSSEVIQKLSPIHE